jgi:thiamine biosynthesis lipoprotein
VVASGQAAADRAARSAVEAIRGVARSMSTYRADSELTRLNASAAAGPVAVSEPLWEVITAALDLSRRSGGAFDATYSPLRDLWRSAAANGELPSESALAEARARVGWRKVVTDPAKRTVHFEAGGMKLDLGGLAKGYALDLAAAAIRRNGLNAGIVDLGGDLRVVGSAEEGRPWTVGIRDALKAADKTAIRGRLRLADVAVATSGNYERYFLVDGRKFSHIIDPATGRPAEEVVSATVIAPTGMAADGLATAVSVLGMEKGVRLVEDTPGAECLLVSVRDGKTVERRSSGFSKFEVPSP